MDGLSPYLTVSEAADELGVSIPSVWESVDSGELPSVPTRLIPRPAFEAYRREMAMRAAADRESLLTEMRWVIKIGHLAA